MATLNEKQAKLFTDRNWGVIATIREDGSPQATPVWIDYDGESVLINSAHGRTKVKNIERDPRATVTVLPAEDQQSGYVMVSGAAKSSRKARSNTSTCSPRSTWGRTSTPTSVPARGA